MNINYEYYKVFYYVAKYKSFTAAAKAMLNNQPNITRMMKKLEAELGCVLFVRQRHGISLTPEGERLYEHISVAVEHITVGENEVAKNKGLQSGTVTIAASEIALHCVLLPVLKEFRNKYPGIHVKISSNSTPQSIKMINTGLADFAIVTEPFEMQSLYDSYVLGDIEEVPVCSTTFFTKGTKCITCEKLMEYPVIGLGEKTSSFEFYSDFFAAQGLSYAPDVEAATADQIIPMVKSDLGIGFVPAEFLEKEDCSNLVILELANKIPKRNICMLKRKDNTLSIAASELSRMIKKV